MVESPLLSTWITFKMNYCINNLHSPCVTTDSIDIPVS